MHKFVERCEPWLLPGRICQATMNMVFESPALAAALLTFVIGLFAILALERYASAVTFVLTILIVVLFLGTMGLVGAMLPTAAMRQDPALDFV
jgi:hypothetical protein